jgi:hypothetical protein
MFLTRLKVAGEPQLNAKLPRLGHINVQRVFHHAWVTLA